MDFKEVLERMLERVSSKYSKRQDSPIYNALAPVSYILSQIYRDILSRINGKFAETAQGIDLDRIAKEVGIDRFQATATVLKAEFKNESDFKIDIPLGFRISIDDYIFKTIKRLELGVFLIEAEHLGDETNYLNHNNILSVDNFTNLARVSIVEVVEKGESVEKDESLRDRFYIKVREPATSGNVYHYKRWATEVAGVGKAKVFPLFKGAGTVKVVIIDKNMGIADNNLIQKVSSYIEEKRPIGADVTVESALTKSISIDVKLTAIQGADIENIKNNIRTAFNDYFKEISFDEKVNYVSYAKLGNLVLDIKDVLDYRDLRINNSVSNVILKENEIPILGNFSVGV